MTGSPSHDEMRATGRALADAFAAAWSRANADALVALFADDGVLIETPFSEPVRGTAALRRWAGDIPYSQSEITFTVGEVFVAGPWFSTEFRLRFRRRRSGDWVEARGAFFAETDGGKLTELRIYWHRWIEGREA